MNAENGSSVRSEVVKECVKLGKTVVEEFRGAFINNQEIDDGRIEQFFTPLINFVETEIRASANQPREKVVARKRKPADANNSTKRAKWTVVNNGPQTVLYEMQSVVEDSPQVKKRADILADDVAGNVISVYGATNGKAEVWYYLMEQNFEGILLQKFERRGFFTTSTIDPIELDTVLNWNVKAKVGKKAIYISRKEQRDQEKQLQLSLRQK